MSINERIHRIRAFPRDNRVEVNNFQNRFAFVDITQNEARAMWTSGRIQKAKSAAARTGFEELFQLLPVRNHLISVVFLLDPTRKRDQAIMIISAQKNAP
jgi:hypothetical protein